MVAYSDATSVPDHVWLFVDFARVTLEDLTSDGSLDGPHAKLVEAAGVLVLYIAAGTDKLWPGDATRLLDLVGEAAILFVCELRGHPRTHHQMRSILQRLYDACGKSITNRPATTMERRQQYVAFCSTHVAVREMENLRSLDHSSPNLGETNRIHSPLDYQVSMFQEMVNLVERVVQ